MEELKEVPGNTDTAVTEVETEATNILDMPLEILEQVGSFLVGLDIARFSLACRRLYGTFNKDHSWRSVTADSELHISGQIWSFCQSWIESSSPPAPGSLSLAPPSIHKLSYLVGERLRRNWATSNYKEGLIHHLSEDVRVGWSPSRLVVLESGRLRSWSVDGYWIHLLSSTPIHVRLENPHQTVYQILVSGDLAILCFTFGGGNESDFQQLQAHDTNDNCKLLWIKTGLLGCQYNVVRLLAEWLVVLDMVKDEIQVYKLCREQPEQPFMVLRQPPDGVQVRGPHGSLSGSSDYLVVPGKRSPDNTPVLSVWHLASGKRSVLEGDRPVCPFRWFQHTAIADQVILGLLNRFRLLGWHASSSSLLFTTDLTATSPGDSSETFSWLTVTEPQHGLVLTVHPALSAVSVVTVQGLQVGEIVPNIGDWASEQGTVTMVEQVEVVGLTCVLRAVTHCPARSQPSCAIYTALLSPFLHCRAGESLTVSANLTAEHREPPGAASCTLLVNHSKVFEVRPLGIKFYDYLHTEEPCRDQAPSHC